MIKKDIAVVLLSGGMDSAVCAAITKSKGFDIATLHLNYGQKTQRKELECFHKLSDHFEAISRLVIDVTHFSLIGGSSLTDKNIQVEHAGQPKEGIPSSYVPFRNGNIIAIAASWAEIINAVSIVIGATQVDYSGYPDCREEFFDAMQKTINLGTKPETKIEIQTPILFNSKSDIVKIGMELTVPLELTWSCYSSEETACGICDSCVLRLNGFSDAQYQDTIHYSP